MPIILNFGPFGNIEPNSWKDVDNLVFHNDKIEGKVENNFTYLSSYYLHHFIENSDKTREELYELVQAAGSMYYPWPAEHPETGPADDFLTARLVTSWSTTPQDVEQHVKEPPILRISSKPGLLDKSERNTVLPDTAFSLLELLPTYDAPEGTIEGGIRRGDGHDHQQEGHTKWWIN